MTELERMSQAESYINRYFEFEDAITVSNENKEYLATYIRDLDEVAKEFNMEAKKTRSIMIGVAIAAAAALLLLIPCHKGGLLLVPIITFVVLTAASIIFLICLNKYKLTAALDHQKEVNDGIKEQIEILDLRIAQMEKQRDEYFAALQTKIDFMQLNVEDMKNISVLKGYIEDGSAETCEEAADLYEQNMLMAQMTNIIQKSEKKPAPTQEENLERFGDPLKMIEENKKKKKKEKRAKK